MNNRTLLLALLTTSGLLSITSPALAQSDAEVETDPGLVVTAQRREQNLLDVPLSVAVVSSQVLEDANLVSVADLPQLATGLSYNTNFGGGFQIRGVGSQSVLISAEQSVSIVVDDIVQGLPEISFAGPSYQALTDIERIEVLRGPQGTLFGKNSSAGVVQVITRRPELEEYFGDGTISYGTDNEFRTTANANLPLGQSAAVRLSAWNYRRDGFVTNRLTGEDLSGYNNWGIRGKFLLELSDRAEIYVIAGHAVNEDSGNGIWTINTCGSGFGSATGLPRYNACNELAQYGVTPGPNNISGAWDGPLGVIATNDSASARFTYDFEGGPTLTAITGYYEVDIDEDVDTDSSPRPIISFSKTYFQEHQFTQELRLEGTVDNLDYTVGGFYYNAQSMTYGLQKGTFNLVPDNSPILLTTAFGPVRCCASVLESETESVAVFGQATLRLFADRLSLTGGLRYTQDEVTLDSFTLNAPNTCQTAFASGGACSGPFPSPISTASASEENLSGRITAQYALTPDLNVYATYSTGYKGPLIGYARAQPLRPVNAETSENYEIGVKGSFLDDRLVATLAIFQTEYTDFQGQTTVVDPNNPAVRSLVTTNAGGLNTEGVEVDFVFNVTDNLRLRGGYSYVPTEFVDFAIQCQDRYTNPGTTPGECTYISPQAPGVNQFNAGGYPLIYAPEHSFNVGMNYDRNVFTDYHLGVALNYNWRDDTYTVAADPNSIVEAYGLLGGNISIGPDDDRWRLSLFGRNLLDEFFVSGVFKTPLDAGTAGSTPLSTIGYSNIPAIESSRTLGLKLEVNF